MRTFHIYWNGSICMIYNLDTYMNSLKNSVIEIIMKTDLEKRLKTKINDIWHKIDFYLHLNDMTYVNLMWNSYSFMKRWISHILFDPDKNFESLNYKSNRHIKLYESRKLSNSKFDKVVTFARSLPYKVDI